MAHLRCSDPQILLCSAYEDLIKCRHWIAQLVKNLPATQNQVRSLGQEDPLEWSMTAQSSILAWRIPWTEEPVEDPTVHSLQLLSRV